MTVADRLRKLFLDNPGKVLTLESIYARCWRLPWRRESLNSLRSMVSYIRPDLRGSISAVRGIGYVYTE